MLVLSRKEDDKIIIGENIVITVVELNRGRVKIGIDAPENVEIQREEIYRQIELENKDAATDTGTEGIDLESLKNLKNDE